MSHDAHRVCACTARHAPDASLLMHTARAAEGQGEGQGEGEYVATMTESILSDDNDEPLGTTSYTPIKQAAPTNSPARRDSAWRSRPSASTENELAALRQAQADARARQQALLGSMMQTNTDMVELLSRAATPDSD